VPFEVKASFYKESGKAKNRSFLRNLPVQSAESADCAAFISEEINYSAFHLRWSRLQPTMANEFSNLT